MGGVEMEESVSDFPLPKCSWSGWVGSVGGWWGSDQSSGMGELQLPW